MPPAAPGLEHHRIPTNGVVLHVVTDGPPDGPPILLLHGFPDFWYGWRHQIGPLATAGFRVIVPDQRGYTESDKPRDIAEYGRDVLAADAIGLLDAFGAARAHVVGHDWGGAVAWWLAQQFPERVATLSVLNCPHPRVFGRALRENRTQRLRSWYMAFFQLPVLPEAVIRVGMRAMLRGLAASANPGSFTDEDLERYREAWSHPGALTGMLNWYRAGARIPGSPPKSRTIAPPTLLIWGERDRVLGPELAQPSIDRCEWGQLERIPEAGHWVQDDCPGKVNALLLAFLRENPIPDT
jgi:pimeloyl-ACP methyl ester carboxylesterase